MAARLIAAREAQDHHMPDLIAIGRHGISHVLLAAPAEGTPPCPDCGSTTGLVTEIVHDDQTAELEYDDCGHWFVGSSPTLGEATIDGAQPSR
ncbi:hypothetical protein ACGFZU_06355 [Streptomyces tendae]|uniref:hypothetical protein n=1 Tax=Streptomyces tendae TaxID=1932 RepID=UPI00371306AF